MFVYFSVMRMKDENKRIAIFHAAMEVITINGLANTSMSKIAKVAGVSPSTLYVYFENKEDMLNKLYLMAKKEMCVSMFQGKYDHTEVKGSLEHVLRRYVSYSLSFPVKFSFQEQFYNSPNISPETRKETYQYSAPLVELIDLGIRQGIVKEISHELITAFIFAPLIFIAKAHHNNEIEVTAELIDKAIEMAWQAIRA